MIAEKITAVARRWFFHSEKSATSAIIAQRSGIVKPYANWRSASS
jgi:hypothetical protein